MTRNKIFFLAAILCGCGPGVSDLNESLGSNYKFVFADDMNQYIVRGGEVAVPSSVVDHKWDDKFVVAARLVVNQYSCGADHVLSAKFDRQVEYWLVDKAHDRRVMTLNLATLEDLMAEWGVPSNLRLNEQKLEKYREKFSGWASKAGEDYAMCTRHYESHLPFATRE